MNYIRSTGALALGLVLTAFVTCKGDERAPQLEDDMNGPPSGGASGRAGSSADEPDASASEPDASAGGSRGDAGPGGVVNCGAVTCVGAGKCVLGENDEPTCVCDDGYVLSYDGVCLVDEACIKLRTIEKGCRQRLAAEPAIALAFNMETCAGTSVQPAVLGDVTRAFKVLEDNNDLGDESYASVLDRDVESWVILAIDMSSSVAGNSGLVESIIESLRAMVASLAPAEGELPIHIQLMPFGRSVNTALPFTTDLAQVDSALVAIRTNPQQAVTEPDGTNLNGVVNDALETLEDTLDARALATDGAIVSTGTLVTITDGRDTSGVRLKPVPARFNVISIGISGNINDQELTRVGPQGSFLAPNQVARDAAFTTVAQRVKEYPGRTYVLAYCSPAVDGNHAVQATLANLEANVAATCEFDARDFGTGSPCNETFIQTYCEEPSHGCGGFMACDPACIGVPADAGPISAAWQFSN